MRNVDNGNYQLSPVEAEFFGTENIFNYAGGYGCLHTVAGVSIFSVPKEDVMRNVDNGNYQLSPVEAYRDWETDRKSTRLNSSHSAKSRMPSSA